MSRKRDHRTLELPWLAPELRPGQGLAEPRLWVRRFRLWHDFDVDDPSRGRSIKFERGLNIISSPVGRTAERVSTGHAAGKTLLCRQLRYCLGEDSFADPEDAAAIRERFPHGGVGAEIRLCGETWVVRRGFSARADDRATKSEQLEELADDVHRGTFGAFRSAVEAVAFSDAHRALLKEFEEVEVPWQFVLAWLTRDQESRLDGLTHWRHRDSSSHSPVRRASAETRLNVLRMVLELYSEQSNAARRRVNSAVHEVNVIESEVRLCEERVKVLRRDLATTLQVDEREVWPPPEELLQNEQTAREGHLRRLGELIDQRIRAVRAVELTSAQEADEQELEEAKGEFDELEERIEAALGDLKPVKEHFELLWTKKVKDEEEFRRATNPTCPYDNARIDVERAKFVCPLPRLPDPVAAEREARETEALRRKIADEVGSREEAVAKLKRRRGSLKARIKNLESRVEAHQLAVSRASVESQAAWAAKGTLRNFVAAVEALERARATEKRAKDERGKVLELRNSSLSSYSTGPLTKWFDVLVKRIVAAEAAGEVTLDGKGLHAIIYWRGRRRSVALNSLRIVLFDLAAMLCAVEGGSSAPAFLVHDSPREGDLDQWTYARLFEAVFNLGRDEKSAPFQYIVTTTTEPPDEQVGGCVRDELSAESAEKRLFRVDL